MYSHHHKIQPGRIMVKTLVQIHLKKITFNYLNSKNKYLIPIREEIGNVKRKKRYQPATLVTLAEIWYVLV